MIRYAVFSRVSSEEQVKDKDSLHNQVEECRLYASRIGGTETAGPFIAPGYSASEFEGLTDAMNAIPALKDAMTAAANNQFDVLLVRYFDRLGSVAEMTFTRLKKLRIQLRSVQEITPIVDPPELYDPRKDDSTMAQIKLAGIYQEGRINRLVNNLRENMPKRIREGLPPSRMPYGYRHINSKTPPEPEPDKVAKLIRARDMLMEGATYTAIARMMGVDRERVETILSNEFYMGLVVYNKTYIQKLGTERRQIPLPKSKWTTGQGKHVPVFTPEEHDMIVAEIARRTDITRRRPGEHPFSGMLYCGVCGDRMRFKKHGSKTRYREVVSCRGSGLGHMGFPRVEFTDMLIATVRRELEHYKLHGIPKIEDKSKEIRDAIQKAQERRKNVQKGYEDGIYTGVEANARLRELEHETEALQSQLEKMQEQKQSRAGAEKIMDQIDWSHFAEYVKTRGNREVNRLLSSLIRKITVYPTGRMEIELR